jgi:uncharacterized membrane protein required for colicin V production
MNLPNFTISWVDMITVLVILVGILRGRKRGLSEELLDTVQWVTIIVACAYSYRIIGDFLHQKPLLSQLSYYVLSYILVALVIKGLFALLKRQIGQKLVSGDAFGRGEYYLGMMAGTLRWTCMYLFILSMLHAPVYSSEYRAAKAKRDAYNYGDITFPSIMSLQDEVYTRSFTGKSAKQYIENVLMEPASGDSKQLRGEGSIAKRREREVDDAFGRK